MKQLRTLIAVWLLTATVLYGYSVARDNDNQQREPNITVVHSGESLTIKWNSMTHEEVRNETADGNTILTVQPKTEKAVAEN